MDREVVHKPVYITCISLACTAFVVTCVINAFASTGITDLFNNTTGGVSNYYNTDITPAGWTFSIWSVIYLWQALWLIYGLSTICRKTAYGYIYVNPCHQPPAFYLIYIFNMATNICWLFLWDRFMPAYALIPIFLLPLSLYVMLFISYKRCYFATPILIREGKKADVWLTRALTQNGLAIYAAWTTIASLINLDVVLVYVVNMNMTTAGTICLTILLIVILTWFFLDILALDRFVRYTLTPYFVFVFALSGVVVKLWDPNSEYYKSSNAYLSTILLGVSVILLVIKIILVVYRALKNPLFASDQGVFCHQVTYGAMSSERNRASAPDYYSS